MPCSGMLCRVALVRTDVPEELSTSIIRLTRVGELGTTLAITSNRCMLSISFQCASVVVTAIVVPSSPILVNLMIETLSSSETSVLARATRHNIPEDGILQHNFIFHIIHVYLSLVQYVCSLIWHFSTVVVLARVFVIYDMVNGGGRNNMIYVKIYLCKELGNLLFSISEELSVYHYY
jgi:hypothetical protein